jgi:hypothetical protein
MAEALIPANRDDRRPVGGRGLEPFTKNKVLTPRTLEATEQTAEDTQCRDCSDGVAVA